MKELKYCCESFESFATIRKELAPNIRIVRFTSKFFFENVPRKFAKNPLRFMLTLGYQGEYNIQNAGNSIMYCPFCGTDLYKFYKDIRYATEVEGETFTA